MVLSLTTAKREPNITIVEISGRIAIGRDSGQIESTITDALNKGARKIVIDLAHVSSIDSSGIGIIAYCYGKASKTGAQMHVTAIGRVMDVFQITHLNQVIRFFPDVDSACDAFAETVSAT